MKVFKDLTNFRKDGIRLVILEAVDSAFLVNDPESIVRDFLGQRILKGSNGRIFVIGFGKAARKMYEGASKALAEKIYSSAIIVRDEDGSSSTDEFLIGDHPLPQERSIKSSTKLMESIRNLTQDDTIIVLVSGGGSAMFELLEDYANLRNYNSAIECLMRAGANVRELNAVRYLHSKTKGGGLLQYTYPAKVLGLIISDVPGDRIDTVASGPTSGSPSDEFLENVLEKYGGSCKLPSIRKKRENVLKSTAGNYIVLRNADFLNVIKKELTLKGSSVLEIGTGISGSTKEVAQMLVSKVRAFYWIKGRPFFFIGGGETSTVVKHQARGGRNLELCLRFISKMNRNEVFTFGSFGTDGMDGSSGAMGAIVDQESLKLLGKKNISQQLKRSESLEPLTRTKDVLITGPTGTNVSDIFVGYYAGERGSIEANQEYLKTKFPPT